MWSSLAVIAFNIQTKVWFIVFNNTQSGAAIANEVLIHTGSQSYSYISSRPSNSLNPAADGLPFGGIGPSGRAFLLPILLSV